MRGEPMTFSEIGHALGCSQSRANQIYMEAMRKLRTNSPARKEEIMDMLADENESNNMWEAMENLMYNEPCEDDLGGFWKEENNVQLELPLEI